MDLNLSCEERDQLNTVEFRLAAWPGHTVKCVEVWTTGANPIRVGVLYPSVGGFNFLSRYGPEVALAAPDALSIICNTLPGLAAHLENFIRNRKTK